MKTNQLLIALFLAGATLFAACDDTIPVREQSPADSQGAGCYIFDNTSNVVISPADGSKFLISSGGVQDTLEAKEFKFLVGRSNALEVADSFELEVFDADGVFTLDSKVRFAAGEAVDTITVETSLDFGQSADLVVAIPESKASIYSAAQKTINVLVDYTWVSRGKVEFVAFEVPVKVSIEKAKEATDSLFRLKNVFYEWMKEDEPVDYDLYSKDGIHLKFILDNEYNIVSLVGNGSRCPSPYTDYFSTTGWNAEYIFSDLQGTLEYAYTGFSDLGVEGFSSVGNVYLLETHVVNEELYGNIFTFSWTWEKESFPGELIDPAEGEDVLAEMDFTVGTLVESADTVHTFTFTNSGVKMQLVLLGETLEAGSYKIVAAADAEVGNAVAGEFDGTAPTGSYIDALLTKYYLTSGKVDLAISEDNTKYELTVEAKTATGREIKATGSIDIPVTPPEPEPAPLKNRVKVKRINF